MGSTHGKKKNQTTNQPLIQQDSISQAETTNQSGIQQTPSPLTQISDVWDVVGTDNVPELPVGPVVMQDKMSMLLYGIFLRDDEDKASELLQKAMLNMPPSGTPYAISDLVAPQNPGKKSFAKLKSYICNPAFLFFNFRRAVCFYSDYSDQDQFDALGIRPSTYSSYKLDKAYNIIPLPFTNSNRDTLVVECSSINQHEELFRPFISSGFPYYCNNGAHACFPIYESNSLRMQFVLRGESPQKSMMVAKHVSLFVNKNGTSFLGKQYFPVIFLRDDFKDVYSVFAGLPGKKEKYLPLYNTYGVKKIEKAGRVVICGTLEDADAMQRYAEDNGDKKTAFVAFVCDPGEYAQVDVNPLKGKTVEFLISNHSGKTIDEERIRVRALYDYLKGMPQRPRIKEFCFRERFVQYPSDNLLNLNDYYNVYTPKVESH